MSTEVKIKKEIKNPDEMFIGVGEYILKEMKIKNFISVNNNKTNKTIDLELDNNEMAEKFNKLYCEKFLIYLNKYIREKLEDSPNKYRRGLTYSTKINNNIFNLGY